MTLSGSGPSLLKVLLLTSRRASPPSHSGSSAMTALVASPATVMTSATVQRLKAPEFVSFMVDAPYSLRGFSLLRRSRLTLLPRPPGVDRGDTRPAKACAHCSSDGVLT